MWRPMRLVGRDILTIEDRKRSMCRFRMRKEIVVKLNGKEKRR
jgi:hypothetical protein